MSFIFYRKQKLRAYIEQIAEVNDADWALFSSCLIKREFSKKNKFLKVGDTENYISFLESGIVRLFIPKEDEEKEITFGFCFEGEFVSAYDSFLTQTPSLYEVETLTQTVMWSISFDDLQKVKSISVIKKILSE